MHEIGLVAQRFSCDCLQYFRHSSQSVPSLRCAEFMGTFPACVQVFERACACVVAWLPHWAGSYVMERRDYNKSQSLIQP